MKKTGYWSLLSRFERELPTKGAFVAKWLQDIPEDRRDLEYIAVVTDMHNIHSSESMRVDLNENATKLFLEYVDSYGSLHQEFEPKVANVRAEQSSGKRIMKILPVIPAIMSHSRETHALKKQTYQRLVDLL